ncbi:hypothetical protein RvY_08837 [Ramazzottius varieornatus]|uniref:Uncharacterized protein n=1 Tax=Ramazzottius varieornatus TaxID=947166 RepID=A0A1D1VF88_RAMVA|nr:hypothetical protein RvY_08837 [Ramazzottius varieornatus]
MVKTSDHLRDLSGKSFYVTRICEGLGELQNWATNTGIGCNACRDLRNKLERRIRMEIKRPEQQDFFITPEREGRRHKRKTENQRERRMAKKMANTANPDIPLPVIYEFMDNTVNQSVGHLPK